MIDYHVHSTHSADAESSVMQMCRRAVEIGVGEIGFTDHLDFHPGDTCCDYLRYDDFMRDIERARSEFDGRLKILAGVEVDYQPEYHRKIEKWLYGKEFDYIVGSAHYIDGVILEDHEVYFPGKTPIEAYLPYFDAAEKVIRSGLFDVLAHLDLCKRHGSRYFGAFAFADFSERLNRLLRLLIESGMVMEVNTSGLRQTPKDTYPSIRTVRRYRDLGGKLVSVGSDAHRAGDLAAGVAGTMKALEAEGFTLVRFEHGRLTSVC